MNRKRGNLPHNVQDAVSKLMWIKVRVSDVYMYMYSYRKRVYTYPVGDLATSLGVRR